MSAGTLKKLPVLYAHVPVDAFDIVNGPSWAVIMEAMEFVYKPLHKVGFADGYYPTYEITFTLKTAASNEVFRRKIKVCEIFGVHDGIVSFTGIFCGEIIGGWYNTKNHHGWFNVE